MLDGIEDLEECFNYYQAESCVTIQDCEYFCEGDDNCQMVFEDIREFVFKPLVKNNQFMLKKYDQDYRDWCNQDNVTCSNFLYEAVNCAMEACYTNLG